MTRASKLFEELEARVRRIELAAALARAGGIQIDDAARVLWSELSDLGEDCAHGELAAFGAFADAAREIGRQAAQLRVPEQRRRVLILDDSEVTRDLIVIAIEAQGHAVKVARDLRELGGLFSVYQPDLILTEAALSGTPITDVCAALHRLTAERWVPIVLFSQASGAALATLALNAGADRSISKDQGISSLIAELEVMFEEILW